MHFFNHNPWVKEPTQCKCGRMTLFSNGCSVCVMGLEMQDDRERLKRVGISNDEAKVRSANIYEIAEVSRND